MSRDSRRARRQRRVDEAVSSIGAARFHNL